jgi:hypothetical protein
MHLAVSTLSQPTSIPSASEDAKLPESHDIVSADPSVAAHTITQSPVVTRALCTGAGVAIALIGLAIGIGRKDQGIMDLVIGLMMCMSLTLLFTSVCRSSIPTK